MIRQQSILPLFDYISADILYAVKILEKLHIQKERKEKYVLTERDVRRHAMNIKI